MTDALNAAWLGSCLALSVAAVALVERPSRAAGGGERRLVGEQVDVGQPHALRDARGVEVPAADYARVVSLNVVADHLLIHLIEPERVLAVTDSSAIRHPEGWRFGGRPSVPLGAGVEAVLALKPDLVVASKFTDEAQITRLREAGVAVFDLGEMRGVDTTLESIESLGALLRQPARAARLAARYRRELAGLSAGLSGRVQPAGLYLSVYGDALFGGTAGTSYADMLRYGGVDDLAARRGYREWPQYSPAQLLTLDPALIVTQEGMGALICEHGQLAALRACQPGGRIVELAGTYHSDPGLGLVEAAASVQRGVYDLEHSPHSDRGPTSTGSPP